MFQVSAASHSQRHMAAVRMVFGVIVCAGLCACEGSTSRMGVNDSHVRVDGGYTLDQGAPRSDSMTAQPDSGVVPDAVSVTDLGVELDGRQPMPDGGFRPDANPLQDAGPTNCEDPATYLERTVWGPVFEQRNCIACHRPEGDARRNCGTDAGVCAQFELLDPNVAGGDSAGSFRANIAQIAAKAYPSDGPMGEEPHIIVKATGGLSHRGGAMLERDSEAHRYLVRLLDVIQRWDGEECADDTDPEALERLRYASLESSWRQITIQVAGRLPTSAELAQLTGLDDVTGPAGL